MATFLPMVVPDSSDEFKLVQHVFGILALSTYSPVMAVVLVSFLAPPALINYHGPNVCQKVKARLRLVSVIEEYAATYNRVLANG